MELVDQHTKSIMEGCKERARDAGLTFEDESLEYIVTNRDLLELSPKMMIPTLYDYWVHDVEVLKEKGKYELYPGNPYETVINTRPAISFYNDNNPDWLNVMIFYHVLGHIDFFQNNLYFRHTWDYDFNGQALADKRLIARYRSEKGRWVDYVIEFARGVDNLVGYHHHLGRNHFAPPSIASDRLNYYFDVFLQKFQDTSVGEYIKAIERYNECLRESPDHGESTFFTEIDRAHPEFKAMFEKHRATKTDDRPDVMQYVLDNSRVLKKEENQWMRSILEIVRNTALFFQPQIRTKIMNEGWASYWHETLFLQDDRIRGHEVDFARVNAGVTAMPRVGLNPYALGMRLFYGIEEKAEKGQLSLDYERLANARERKDFNRPTGVGRQTLFDLRENYCDFMFLREYVDQDFVDAHDLFVTGKRLNKERMVWEYYVKSRDASQYRQMLLDSLYHPPSIRVALEENQNNDLYLVHEFEGKPLVRDFVPNTLMGLEYLWGGPVKLETHEAVAAPTRRQSAKSDEPKRPPVKWRRVLYTMEDRKIRRTVL